jgi:hypothetical protein
LKHVLVEHGEGELAGGGEVAPVEVAAGSFSARAWLVAHEGVLERLG